MPLEAPRAGFAASQKAWRARSKASWLSLLWEERGVHKEDLMQECWCVSCHLKISLQLL